MKVGLLAILLGAASVIATPVFAHHSFAMYDRNKTLTLSGTVKEFIWTAPHVTIQVLTENASGRAVIWQIEGSSPSVLARGGWTYTLMRPGDKISLGIHPRRDHMAGGLLADERQMLINGMPPKGVLSLQPLGPEAAISDCANE